MKSLKQRNISAFNKIAEIYDKGLLKKWSLITQESMLKFLKIKKNSNVLDSGCGTGNLLLMLSERDRSLNLYGIDISREMLKIAKEKLKDRAKLRKMPLEQVYYKNKFDYIFSVDAFHHYYDQKKAIRNMYRALKKGGRLVIADVDFTRIFNHLFHLIEPGNNKIMTHKEMIRLLIENNFHNIKQKKIWHFTFMTAGQK